MFELRDEKITANEIPVAVPLIQVRTVHCSLTEVVTSVQQLTPGERNYDTAPYLEVREIVDCSGRGIRHKVETAFAGKNIQLAKINVRYESVLTDAEKKTGQVEFSSMI